MNFKPYQAESVPQQPAEETKPAGIEQLLEWLEELWFDEEIRDVIDHDNFERMIESLKEML